MKRSNLVILSLMLAILFSVSLASSGFAKEEKGTKVTVEGNVICLLPDYQKGTVNPVIANGPCNNNPPHQHLLVSKEGKVYVLQGLDEGLMPILQNPNHTDVKITGMAMESPEGWILYVQ